MFLILKFVWKHILLRSYPWAEGSIIRIIRKRICRILMSRKLNLKNIFQHETDIEVDFKKPLIGRTST